MQPTMIMMSNIANPDLWLTPAVVLAAAVAAGWIFSRYAQPEARSGFWAWGLLFGGVGLRLGRGGEAAVMEASSAALLAAGLAWLVLAAESWRGWRTVRRPLPRGRCLVLAAVAGLLGWAMWEGLSGPAAADPLPWWSWAAALAPGVLVACAGPACCLRVPLYGTVSLLYRIRTPEPIDLPAGGVVLTPNHLSYLDGLALHLAAPRRLRFVVFEGFSRIPVVSLGLRLDGVIFISRKRPREALQRVRDCLKAGEAVVIFPEGHISLLGELLPLKGGYHMVARKAEVPVVPLWIDGTRETWFAPVGGRFFRRWPRLDRPLIQVFAGEPIEPEEAEPVLLRERLLELGAKAFEARPELENHLGEELIRALKSRPWRTALIETYPERRVLSRGMLLAVASLLADRWRSSFDGRRVGVVLPPGAGATVANLALVLADKIPVNLNFTLGKGAAAHCIKRGELGAVVTAAAMQEKVGDFPWPDRVVDIKEELQGLGKGRILRRLAMIGLLPSRILRRRYDLSEGGDREAGLLFTSGSSGVPKGVPLSHRNLISNIRQIDHCGLLRSRERMLGCLPVFHSFGFTVTLWYPLLRGLVLVTSPSPLETGRLAGVIEAEKVTIYFGTPTFMRTFLKRVEPNQLASLQLAVAGAEKLPQDLAEAWEERFGVTVLEGYGLTETSPVVAANLPDPHHAKNQPGQPGGRRGSVGRPLPGVAVRLRKPESDELVPLTETGVLEVSGPNVFRGYLGGKNATAKAMTEDGWFVTGDLARMDEDGFLFIEGRISRFSKIGGEMVPHGLIEETLIKAKDWGGEEKTPLVVMGVPDKSKGEALILLTRHKLEKSEVREILSKADLPNLWVPRKIVSVEEIPSLASGKLDLRSCRDLAEKAADESGNGTGDDDGGGDDGEENSSGNEGRKGKDEKS